MTRRKLATYTAAVIYLRVSTDGQRVSGLGREAQEAACREHCARHGWAVQAVHCDDGLSGTLPVEERPGLAAAVEAARAAGVVLLVYSVSRAARSVGELYRLVDPRDGSDPIPLVSVSEPFDLTTAMGKAFLGMLAVLAALESDLASERTIAALAAAKARGVKLGAPRVYDGAHPGVIRAQALRAEGMSERDIADQLNHEGVPTARPGGRWHQKTVRAALAV
jgi:DNA invertase Pin-like site-specific DNA recombinase